MYVNRHCSELLAVCQLAEYLGNKTALCTITQQKNLIVPWLSHVFGEIKIHFGLVYVHLATCEMNNVPVTEQKVLIKRGRECLHWYVPLPLKGKD